MGNTNRRQHDGSRRLRRGHSGSPDASSGARSGTALYRDLAEYATTRHQELTERYARVVDVVERYGVIVAETVRILGTVAPGSCQDGVVRDLVADVFDFLVECNRPLFEGRPHVVFPLARRAYESLSLMAACLQDEVLAGRWAEGKQLQNGEIRKALASLPFFESEDDLRALYGFFSQGAHPNRGLVAKRFLGDGNEFVLGSIGEPDLPLVTELSLEIVRLWFWFGANVLLVLQQTTPHQRPNFGAEYLSVAAEAREVIAWLQQDYDELLALET